MEWIMKSQVAKILLLLSFLSFLLLIPFISASLRSSYLYLLLNLLIIVLGVEAGLLASISKPHVDVEKKPVLLGVVSSSSSSSTAAREAAGAASHDQISRGEEDDGRRTQEVLVMAPLEKLLQVEKKTAETAERVQKLKRCRSRPSIFFIGGCDDEEDHDQLLQQQQVNVVVEEKVAVEEYSAGDLSKQELFMKAEMFIGNFYKQLKMQREESWKKIHGLYHRAF